VRHSEAGKKTATKRGRKAALSRLNSARFPKKNAHDRLVLATLGDLSKKATRLQNVRLVEREALRRLRGTLRQQRATTRQELIDLKSLMMRSQCSSIPR
jgi:hypothetical protein